jgi:hypothetical protein
MREKQESRTERREEREEKRRTIGGVFVLFAAESKVVEKASPGNDRLAVEGIA